MRCLASLCIQWPRSCVRICTHVSTAVFTYTHLCMSWIQHSWSGALRPSAGFRIKLDIYGYLSFSLCSMGSGASQPELLLGPPNAEVALKPEDNMPLSNKEEQLAMKREEEKQQKEEVCSATPIERDSSRDIGKKKKKKKKEKLKHVMLSGRFTQERFITAQVFAMRLCFQQALPTSTLILWLSKNIVNQSSELRTERIVRLGEVVTKGSGDQGKWWLRDMVTKESGDFGKWWLCETVTEGRGDLGKWWLREVVTWWARNMVFFRVEWLQLAMEGSSCARRLRTRRLVLGSTLCKFCNTK